MSGRYLHTLSCGHSTRLGVESLNRYPHGAAWCYECSGYRRSDAVVDLTSGQSLDATVIELTVEEFRAVVEERVRLHCGMSIEEARKAFEEGRLDADHKDARIALMIGWPA